MRKNYSVIRFLVLGVLSLFISSLAFTQNATKYSVSGVIKDSTGKALQDAAVYISGGKTERVVTNASGFYKFENLDSGKTYKVIPYKELFTFTPETVVFEKIKENKVQDFKAIQRQLFSISGFVKDASGKPLRGVLINVITNISSKLWKAETDSNGFYKIQNLFAQTSLEIIPTKPGITFDPKARKFENLSENKTDQNFTAALPKLFVISGTVKDNTGAPIKGAYVLLGGEKSTKVLVDSITGSYKFENLSAGKIYSVYAYKSQYLFEPKIKIFTPLTKDTIQNFVGTQLQKYSISGYVKNKENKPVGGVMMVLIGSPGMLTVIKEIKATTDSITGFYEFKDLESGTYRLTPVKRGYTFDPKYIGYDYLRENKTQQNFIAGGVPTFSITIYVKGSTNTPLDSVLITLLGGKESKLLTDKSGTVKFENLEGGRYYTVIPAKKGYSFEPKTKTIENLSTDVQHQFTASVNKLYSISGTIKDNNDKPIPDVTVVLTGVKQKKVITDVNGTYRFESLEENGPYVVYPYGKGYIFDPRSKVFDKLTKDEVLNFKASAIPTYTIEGFVKDSTGAALAGVILRLAGGIELKKETDSMGYYKFVNVEAGKLYLLIPSKRGYIFQPRYKIFENLADNMTLDFVGKKVIASLLPGLSFSIRGSSSNSILEDYPQYSIMGFVQDVNSSSVSGVKMILNGTQQVTTETDETGFFMFDNVEEGMQYTLMTSKSGFIFDPPSVTYDDLNENQGQFFTGVSISSITGVNDKVNVIPKEITLYQNYPNPFNPSTIIKYELPSIQNIKLQVFDVLGRLVSTLMEGDQEAGVHEVRFDSKSISSGSYFVRLQANDFIKTIHIKVIK